MARHVWSVGPLALFALVLTGAIVDAPVQAQAPAAINIFDGVYTSGQAARGRALFLTNCSVCHGTDGLGTGTRRSIDILGHWEEATLNDLFGWVKTRMPQSAPGTLVETSYIDAIAFLLEINKFPAGPNELKPDPAYLSRVSIWSAKEGPRPVETGTLVQAVGCLTKAGDAWDLTTATDPKRTRVSTPSTGVELDRARSTALGTQTVRLLAAFPNDAQVNRKVEAKGLMVRNPAGNRISIQALTVLSDTCAG